MKNCIDCNKEIKASSRCSKCWSRKWRVENPERAKELYQEDYDKNKDKKIAHAREWAKNNPDKANASNKKYVKSSNYYSERYQNDIEFRLRVVLRNRLYQAIKNKSKVGSAVEDLGCSIEDFKSYIESKFQLDMNWNNMGE